jgi:hypothetical protein
MPGRQPRRRSPVRVHHALSPHPVSSSGIRSPAIQCPARPVSGHLGSTSGMRRSGRLVSSRPVSSRPVSVRRSGRVRLLPHRAVTLRTRPVRRATCTTGTGRGPGGLPRRRPSRSTASRPGAGDAGELARWSVGVASRLAGLRADGRACPLSNQAGQAGVRSAGGWRREGTEQAAARGAAAAAWLPSWAGYATTVRGCRGA